MHSFGVAGGGEEERVRTEGQRVDISTPGTEMILFELLHLRSSNYA